MSVYQKKEANIIIQYYILKLLMEYDIYEWAQVIYATGKKMLWKTTVCYKYKFVNKITIHRDTFSKVFITS